MQCEMDSCIEAFTKSSLGEARPAFQGSLKVYISEVSSPTRFWFQNANSTDIDDLHTEMQTFYKQNKDAFMIRPNLVQVGMKVAAYALGQYGRAEICDFNRSTGVVRVFFIDYGTTGCLPLKYCRSLFDKFAALPKKAFRAALHGIKPIGGTRLWNLQTTESLLRAVRDRIRRIEIVKHHSNEDFYEIMLYNGDEDLSINEIMVRSGQALQTEFGEIPACLFYPKFSMLEKLSVYPTFAERFYALKEVDFNEFEEQHLSHVNDSVGFQTELETELKALSNDSLQKQALLKMKRRCSGAFS